MTYPLPRAPQNARRSHLLVMAKSPVPGRVKTRLCPPLTPLQAAEVAAAALADTLDAVAGCNADRRIIALDGSPGDWLPTGFEVIAQRGDAFDDRLAAAWHDAAGPGLQIGMDTPQVTPELLNSCLAATFDTGISASLGRAADGGWWAIGFADRFDADLFAGVPMSTPATATLQMMRLRRAGHSVAQLPWLTDVDNIDDAFRVANEARGTTFAAVLRSLRREIEGVA